MTRHTTMILSVIAVGLIGVQAMAQAQPAAMSEADALRQEMAKLKLELDEAVSELKAMRAEQQPADAPQTATPMSIDQKLAALAKQQSELDAALDRMLDTQRRLESSTPSQPAQAKIASPYDYRYQSQQPTTPTASHATPPQQANYTTYSNGYRSTTYQLPAEPVQPEVTAGPVIYSPTYTRVYYSGTPRTYYRDSYSYPSVVYRPFYRPYYRSGISFGVFGDHYSVRFGTNYGGHYRSNRGYRSGCYK